MRKILLIALLFLVSEFAWSQDKNLLKVESYQLPNGFTVFLNQDQTTSRVYGAVMVNAGAKHEDPTATGMAHYLEHLLFKGTSDMGTFDYQKEKVHLDQINVLYDELSKASSAKEKLTIQRKINEQAIKASKYGLPNEFNTLLKSIGSSSINAFTNYEMTFYHNSFPAHEINKWLSIYAKRFQNPVFRSFQSELEVVYEEKNRSQDNFQRIIGETLRKFMYPNRPYGEWSVLGTVEHLKNPSINKMYEFFNKYYVASNMALILTGNFDPAEVKEAIAKNFGKLKRGDVEKLSFPRLPAFKGIEKYHQRITPVKVGFTAFRTVPNSHPDRVALDVYQYILSNESETGLIDRMRKNNEVLYAGTIPNSFNDEGSFSFLYVPKILIGSLHKTEKKILAMVESVTEGTYDEDLLQIAKNELQINFQDNLDNVTSRGRMIGRAFNQSVDWETYVDYPAKVAKITQEDLERVGRLYFGENRMKFVSRTGFPKKSKLKKPPYKPSVSEQKETSEYANEFKQIKSLPYQPKFIDYQNEIERGIAGAAGRLFVNRNPINDLFNLTIRYQIGRLQDQSLITLAGMLNHAGAGEYDNLQLKKAFAVAGIDYSVFVTNNELGFRISGKEASLELAMSLLDQLMTNPKLEETSRKSYLNELTTSRRLEKRDPNYLRLALLDYGRYDNTAVGKQRDSRAKIKKVDLNGLVQKTMSLTNQYQADVTYYGKNDFDEVSSLIDKHFNFTKGLKAEQPIFPATRNLTKNKIFLLHDKKAVQSQVYFYVKSEIFDKKDYAIKNAFNQYFGGGFTGLVLQEIREYRSLAYATLGNFAEPPLAGKEGRLYGFVGTQSDKTNEAINVMMDLIQNMPAKPERMEALRSSLQLRVITDYPEPNSLIPEIINKEKMGYSADPNKEAFAEYETITMDDIVNFHKKYIKDKPIMITIYGDKKNMNLNELKKIGEIVEVDKNDIATF